MAQAAANVGLTILASVVGALKQVFAQMVKISLLRAFGFPVPSFESGGVVQSFAHGGTVQGSGAVPIIAHAGEVVLNRDTVSRLGGPTQANALNSGGPAVTFSMADVPEPTDFGIIASRSQVARLFSAMPRNHQMNGGVA